MFCNHPTSAVCRYTSRACASCCRKSQYAVMAGASTGPHNSRVSCCDGASTHPVDSTSTAGRGVDRKTAGEDEGDASELMSPSTLTGSNTAGTRDAAAGDNYMRVGVGDAGRMATYGSGCRRDGAGVASSGGEAPEVGPSGGCTCTCSFCQCVRAAEP